MPHGRFDYVKYDEQANIHQAAFKDEVTSLEQYIEGNLKDPRYKALALTKLEETYMYIGKAIRNDQIARNNKTELQEERSNS